MAATDVPRPYPNARRITLTNADEWYHVTWDAGDGRDLRVSLRPITNAARFAWETATPADPTALAESDAYDSGNDHYGELDADQWTLMEARDAQGGRAPRTEVFLSSATAGTVVAVEVEGS